MSIPAASRLDSQRQLAQADPWLCYAPHSPHPPFLVFFVSRRRLLIRVASYAKWRALNIAKGETVCLPVELLTWLDVSDKHILIQASTLKNH
jgi:hypothetical protein